MNALERYKQIGRFDGEIDLFDYLVLEYKNTAQEWVKSQASKQWWEHFLYVKSYSHRLALDPNHSYYYNPSPAIRHEKGAIIHEGKMWVIEQQKVPDWAREIIRKHMQNAVEELNEAKRNIGRGKSV
jgi:hypothetical protein